MLENWNDDLDLRFREAPSDLATLAPSFGTTHLLIDDCPSNTIVRCTIDESDEIPSQGNFYHVPTCWNYGVCMPCEPYGHDHPDRCATQRYWNKKCNDTFSGCDVQLPGSRISCVAAFSWWFAEC